MTAAPTAPPEQADMPAHSEIALQTQQLKDLPRELAVIKMENDSIMAAAIAHPRDMLKVVEDVSVQLQRFKRFCSGAIYNKPVGKDPATGQMRFARGLSIRMAEAIAEAYGYNRVRTDVDMVDQDHVKVTATFVDFQRGRTWEDSGIVSKLYKTRNGGTMRTPDDRFYNVVVKAELSRRVREVILRSVPPGIRAELEYVAEEEIDKFLDDSTVEKLVTNFASKGITREMLEGHVGRRVPDFTRDDRKLFAGVWNAIEDGEATVAEVFGTNGNGSNEKSAAERAKEKLAESKTPKRTRRAAEKPAVEPKAEEAPADARESRPAEGTPPDVVGSLVSKLCGQSDCTPEAATERLQGWCEKMYDEPLGKLSPDSLKDLESHISRGTITTTSNS